MDKPWKGGKYCRNIMDKDVPFEEGEDVTKKIEAAKKARECKSREK